MRAEFAAADRVFTKHQGVLTDKVLDPIKDAVILDGIARGEIPPPPLLTGETMVQALRRATKGEWRFPAKLSIDVGRESAANMNENRQGAKSLQEIAAEEGTDAFARLEQIAIEANFVKELSSKYGVPETSIRMVTQQLPANAAMASALGVNVTQDAVDATIAASTKPQSEPTSPDKKEEMSVGFLLAGGKPRRALRAAALTARVERTASLRRKMGESVAATNRIQDAFNKLAK